MGAKFSGTKVYEVCLSLDDKPVFAGTMGEVKAVISDARKASDALIYMPDVRVTECDVRSDKEGLIHALNGTPEIVRGRTWKGTTRGGLKEITDGVL